MTYDTTVNPLVALDRRYTLRFLQSRVSERILDAGCGTGWNLQLLRRAGSEPIRIDFSYGMLAVAHYKNPTAPLVQADPNQALPVRKNVFNVALRALVGEHLTNLPSMFRELFVALRPGGRLVFSVFHPKMAAVGKESNFEQEGVEYRLGAYRYSVTDYLTVLDDCGFRGVRYYEFNGDQALLDEVPLRKEPSMSVEYFEDFEIGAEYHTPARTITETDIVTFVNLFGFHEPLFIDMEFVKNKSLFGSRIAPGSFTFALSEGLTIQSGLVKGGMALLGVQEMKIPAPLRCGDTVHVKVKVLAKRETSKPDRGVVTSEQQVINQKGEVLLEYTVNRMIRRRPVA